MSFITKCGEIFRKTLTVVSPELNTKVLYRVKFHKKLDLNNPKTLNEKILWLKFNTYLDNPLVKQCADKYRVRDFIKDKGFNEILVPLYGVYENPDEIPWDTLPQSFVVKINVGCGKNIIVPDKSKFDSKDATKKLKCWMKEKQWLGYSEMQYKDVKPYVIIEKYIGSEDGIPPVDYKFYCINGKAEYVMVCEGRGILKHPLYFYYDRSWNLQPFSEDALNNPGHVLVKPDGIDKAFDYAQKLSEEFPFVRTDLYITDGHVYFGELTFTPAGGMDFGKLEYTDKLMGDMLILK